MSFAWIFDGCEADIGTKWCELIIGLLQLL